jgi:hypothetical protein
LFDPTIYENMKVIIEGAVYDLDLAGEILVTNRSDQVELSTMSRSYSIQFKLLGIGDTLTELYLSASTEDLSAEILENTTMNPGCTLQIGFQMKLHHQEDYCNMIEESLFEIWGNECAITQRLSYIYGNNQESAYTDEIYLDFGRKFSEAIIEDIPSLLEHVVLSLGKLNEINGNIS